MSKVRPGDVWKYSKDKAPYLFVGQDKDSGRWLVEGPKMETVAGPDGMPQCWTFVSRTDWRVGDKVNLSCPNLSNGYDNEVISYVGSTQIALVRGRYICPSCTLTPVFDNTKEEVMSNTDNETLEDFKRKVYEYVQERVDEEEICQSGANQFFEHFDIVNPRKYRKVTFAYSMDCAGGEPWIRGAIENLLENKFSNAKLEYLTLSELSSEELWS